MLLRFRPPSLPPVELFESGLNVSPGEFAGVGAENVADLDIGITQGEASSDSIASCSGVEGICVSLTGREGGDFCKRAGPLLCEEPLRESVELEARLSSFRSFSSLTASVDFLRTSPAASRAVVARCMMLTLPDLGFPLFFPFDPEPLGVEGDDLDDDSIEVGVGDSNDLGDLERGGVTGSGGEGDFA